MENTTYKINSNTTASLTDDDYLLTVRNGKLDDYDTYKFVNGEWELSYDSLSNRDAAAADVWDRPEFVVWANGMKALARST